MSASNMSMMQQNGQQNNQQSGSSGSGLKNAIENASISHESQHGRIEASGWYLAALVALVVWVVVL